MENLGARGVQDEYRRMASHAKGTAGQSMQLEYRDKGRNIKQEMVQSG